MKVLPEEEFRALAIEQGFIGPDRLSGFIDKETHETVVPEGATTRQRTHEVGHEKLEHYPKALKYYGEVEPWTAMIDDEIEAEIYSFETMGKRITPRVGLQALYRLLKGEWELYPALSLVIGRLRNYGIDTSLKERRDLISTIERAWGEEVEWKL